MPRKHPTHQASFYPSGKFQLFPHTVLYDDECDRLMLSSLLVSALFADCVPGSLELSPVSLWSLAQPAPSPVSLCPQTLGACAPPPCARAPSPLNTPQFILTSIKTFQNPLCRRCRRPMTPDSVLSLAICQPRPRCRDGDRFLGGDSGLS